MQTVRGVLFDAYGTLFDVHSIGAFAEQLYPGRGAELSALWRDKQLEYTRLRTLSDRYADFFSVTAEALQFACERLRLPLTGDGHRRLLEQYGRLTPFADVGAALERLRALELPLAVLSNGSPGMLASMLAAAGMSGLFSHVLSADQVRKYKTAPQLYQLGVDAFRYPASELMFVSANGWDACCATWFGYRTFWVNRSGDPVEALGVAPSGAGRSLDELPGFILDGAR
jgi:2-haloacid dehalogenase